jgi:hypothetical protein
MDPGNEKGDRERTVGNRKRPARPPLGRFRPIRREHARQEWPPLGGSGWPSLTAMPNAIVMTGYGPPTVLKWAGVPLTEPGEGQIRIKMCPIPLNLPPIARRDERRLAGVRQRCATSPVRRGLCLSCARVLPARSRAGIGLNDGGANRHPRTIRRSDATWRSRLTRRHAPSGGPRFGRRPVPRT